MNKAAALDSRHLREAFARFPSGVAAISALHENKPQVIVASSFTVGVSLEPPLAGFFVQKTSGTWSLLTNAPRLGVSILGTEHATICRQLASPNKDGRFKGVDTRFTDAGAVQILGAPVWFDCSVYAVHSAGDHFAVQLLIADLSIDVQADPLIYHRSRFTHLAPAPEMASA